jgi:Ca2+-binding RTX toxin-like protein
MYKFRKASSSDGVDDLKGFGGIDTIVGGPGDSFETSYGLGAAVTISEGTLFSRVLTVNDRAASNWTGTTVDYGDGNGPQTLTVSPVPGGGQFVLTHSWSNSGTYTIFVTLRNDLGRTIEQSLIVTVSNFIPIVTIHNAPTTSPEGTAISLTSTAGNAAGTYTPLTYAWTVTKNGLSYAVGNTSDFSFTPDDNGIYVVTLTVDGDGGVATDTKTITVTNVAPTVSISGAPATSPEGTAISLTSVASDVAGANDPLTFAWTVTKNGLPFASDNTPNFSFTPDDNGIYVVTLVVDDGDGGDTTTTQTIIVLNVAPAAALVGPTSASSNTAVSILSTVKDPAGAEDPLTYQWTVTRNGAAFATQSGGRIFEFTPTLFGAYVFTLVVDDGDGGVTTATHSLTVTSSSTNTAPTVTISGPATGVRGDSITYTFKATDPDAADQAGLFLWTINWGDGSPVQTLSGPAVISVKHIFTAAASSRTITATAKDAANNISAAASKAVQILVWELQPDPLQPGSFILVVGGSMRDDHIRIRDKSSRKNSYYELKFDNDDNDDDDDGQATGGDGQDKFKVRIYQDISGVIILAQAGNDKIDFDAEIDVWSIIDGGDGNDRIKGGGSANIILGGNGDDQLDGENGRDLLIGGRGSDSIKGGKGDDLIISGFTAFDDNREALLAIMKEWTRNTSFASRRDRLMGTTSGGLNGGYFLIPSGASRTVFDDNDVDELWGGDGNDWFLLNMNSAEQSRVDKIKDFRNGDEDDDINLF